MQPDTYLITGASSDIGRELIRELAQTARPDGSLDAKIVAHCRSGTGKLSALTAEIPALAGCMETLCADLAVESDVQALINTVRSKYGFPTHIVHLAATPLRLTRVTEIDWRVLATDIEIQARSIGMLLQTFMPLMVRSGRRCKVVVMLSSVTLATPPKFMAEYVIAKYALLGLFRSVVAEYSDKPICVNAVSPSMVDTQFLSGLPPKYVELAAASHPAKKIAAVTDVVPAIRFLLSPASDYISGVNLPITSGSVV
jgi:3-oxoacyl-[acyl-carrier protein] reductase